MVISRKIQCHKDVNSLSYRLNAIPSTTLNMFFSGTSEAFLKFPQKSKWPSTAHAKGKKKMIEVNIQGDSISMKFKIRHTKQDADQGYIYNGQNYIFLKLLLDAGSKRQEINQMKYFTPSQQLFCTCQSEAPVILRLLRKEISLL